MSITNTIKDYIGDTIKECINNHELPGFIVPFIMKHNIKIIYELLSKKPRDKAYFYIWNGPNYNKVQLKSKRLIDEGYVFYTLQYKNIPFRIAALYDTSMMDLFIALNHPIDTKHDDYNEPITSINITSNSDGCFIMNNKYLVDPNDKCIFAKCHDCQFTILDKPDIKLLHNKFKVKFLKQSDTFQLIKDICRQYKNTQTHIELHPITIGDDVSDVITRKIFSYFLEVKSQIEGPVTFSKMHSAGFENVENLKLIFTHLSAYQNKYSDIVTQKIIKMK